MSFGCSFLIYHSNLIALNNFLFKDNICLLGAGIGTYIIKNYIFLNLTNFTFKNNIGIGKFLF